MNIYNDNDRFAARWLRQLASEGRLPPGLVDGRSIREISHHDLETFVQVHLFAGIGGWSVALDLARWPPGREVWTGSCPCQPLSGAGQRQASDDERHLWPEMFRLIRERKPTAIFGEQVGGPLGYEWLAGVQADMEAIDYAFGQADLCAAGVAAPHIRSRLYWCAYPIPGGISDRAADRRIVVEEQRRVEGQGADRRGEGGAPGGVVNPNGEGPQGRNQGVVRERRGERAPWAPSGLGAQGWLGNAEGQRRGNLVVEGEDQPPWEVGATGARMLAWHDDDIAWIECEDGFQRRVKPDVWPLAHGIPNRVGILQGAGNAICPQIAAHFIGSFMEDRNIKPED